MISKRSSTLWVLAAVGCGLLLGRWTNGLTPSALAAPGDGGASETWLYKGQPRNVVYNVQGKQPQKALRIDEVVLYKDLLVFRENGRPTEAVSVYALENLQLSAAP